MSIGDHMNKELATLLIYLFATGLLNSLIGHKSQIDAWAEKKPTLAAVLKVIRGLGLDPWMLIQAATLATKKRLPLAMQDDPVAVVRDEQMIKAAEEATTDDHTPTG